MSDPLRPTMQDLQGALEGRPATKPLDAISRFQADAARVAVVTVIAARGLEFVPGRAGRVLTKFGIGGEKDFTGRVVLTAEAASNFLPAPVGFAHPESFGLPPNFYLPRGSTALVPQFVDVIGFGLKEQRAEDVAADNDKSLQAARVHTTIREGIRQEALREREVQLTREAPGLFLSNLPTTTGPRGFEPDQLIAVTPFGPVDVGALPATAIVVAEETEAPNLFRVTFLDETTRQEIGGARGNSPQAFFGANAPDP